MEALWIVQRRQGDAACISTESVHSRGLRGMDQSRTVCKKL